MKLDVNVLRYLSKEDFRVLTAVEMGQKNHEIVPATLVDTIAGLKHGGTFKCLKHLLKHKLVHHDNSKYDGYRLTYLGYDYLAIKALVNRGVIAGVGRQIGVGKESDIYEVMGEEGEVYALKLHRLGRTSFRAVKSKRDYLRKGKHFSWLYLSRLGALKEYAFMKALGERGLPVPQAIDHNRHAVVMSLVHAHPLVQVRELHDPRGVYTQLMELLSTLAGLGLIHCDFNEFNLLVDDEEQLTLIDFPQMVSVSHANAQELFERDVECIVRFFSKKLGYVPERDEELETIRPSFQEAVASGGGDKGLDVELAASGFQRHHQETLERFVTTRESDSESGSGSESDSEEDGSEGSGSEVGVSGSSSGSAAESEEAAAAAAGGSLRPAAGKCTTAGTSGPARAAEDAVSNGSGGASSCGASLGGSDDCSSSDGGSGGDSDGEGVEESAGQERRHRQEGGGRSGVGRLADDLASVTVSAADPRAVQQRVAEQQRKAARRAAMAHASRNTAKSKNRGKRRGEGGGGAGGGGGIWG